MAESRLTLASLVDDFTRQGRQIAIVAPHGVRRRRVSYGELAHLAKRFAAELVSRGIGKGDRVLICGENGPEWVAAFFGCVLRGVLPVPIDLASTDSFVARVEREVAPKLAVGYASRLAGLRTPILPFESFAVITSEIATTVEGLIESDPVQIIFTSGTTGEPKGVVHTHKNVLASLRPIEAEMQKYLKYERPFHPVRILHTLPLSHVFGQFMGLWIPPLMAAEVHYESRLVAPEIVAQIKRERISVLAAVPRLLDFLQQHLLELKPDLPSRISAASGISALRRWWRFRDVHRLLGYKFWAFVCGGASLTPASEQFWQALGFVVVQGYGMTETTALVSLNHPFRAARGTIGQVLPGREVRLSDEGEVLVRGDTISNATWQGGQLQRTDSEWLATGDLAEFDAQGNLHFKGRKKDTIVSAAGLNIYPEDLEAALMHQPGVKACAVIETETAAGPEPLAVLLMQASSDPQAAINAANQELAEFQQIRRWIVWPDPDFPRTSTGKPLKREVAGRIASGELKSAPFSIGEHLDSLARVELQARLEQQYGVSLDDTALQRVDTSADVNQIIAAARKTSGGEQHIYPKWTWSAPMRLLRNLFLDVIAMPLLRFLAKPSVQCSIEKFPDTPMLIVANHVTSYDPPFVLYALPRRLRHRVAIAMSGEYIMNWRRQRNQGHWFLNLVAPITYLLVTELFNVFPLPQLSGFRQSFRHAGEAVDRGFNVLVFPEGRRSDDGTPQPFKAGAGLLWKELNIPVLTVRLEGLGLVKRTGQRWFRSGKYRVIVVDLIPPQPDKTAEELTKILEQSVFSGEILNV